MLSGMGSGSATLDTWLGAQSDRSSLFPGEERKDVGAAVFVITPNYRHEAYEII